ncbi:MAG: OmpP1/FadL family transporter [Gemmatimonadota bacterium]
MRRACALFLLCSAIPMLPAAARAQAGVSLLGLGRPEDPVDARMRALGNAGAVAHGRNFSLLNPATLSEITSAGVFFGFATENRDVEGALARGALRGTRFPVGQLVYPFGERWVAAVGFGAFLDQDWLVTFEDTLRLAADTIPFTENRGSEGGLSQLRAAAAWRPHDRVSLALGLDLYAGDVVRSVRRRFDEPNFLLEPYQDEERWEYDAWGWTAGLVVRPIEELHIGGAFSWASNLTATRDSVTAEQIFPMPVRAYGGVSWRIAPDVTWLLQVGFAEWSRAAPALGGAAKNTWSFGTGVEAPLVRRETATYLVRAGYRRVSLPFTTGGDQGREYAWSVGIGGVFANGLVRADATYDIGKRGDLASVGIEESFRRFSFGLSVSQR